MLSRAVYSDLTLLVRYISLIRERLDAGAESSEIDLLIEATRATLRRLGAAIDFPRAPSLGQLDRHLYFLGFFHRRGQPDRYAADIEDITQRDLPGVIDLVKHWEDGLLAPGLVQAVRDSWRSENYVNVVRDAFVYLEQALRSAGSVSPAQGMTAEQLVNRLLRPDSPERIELAGATALSPHTHGELQGAMYLFKGAFLLFRNAAAHRFLEYTPEQTDELLRIVNLCLRLLGTEAAGSLAVIVLASVLDDALLQRIQAVLQKYPGTTPAYVFVEGDDGATARVPLDQDYRVEPSDGLRSQIARLSPGARVE